MVPGFPGSIAIAVSGNRLPNRKLERLMGKDDKTENAREVLEHVMRALDEIKAANVARMFKTRPIAASGGSLDLDEIVGALAEIPRKPTS
jgi:hypothetical protein